MRMQDGYSKMVPFQQDTQICGQVGREKIGKDRIINDRWTPNNSTVCWTISYTERDNSGNKYEGDLIASRLRHGPEKAPGLWESAHSNHGSEDVVYTLLGVTARTIWREEESCGKHKITAYKKEAIVLVSAAWIGWCRRWNKEDEPQDEDTSAVVIGLRLDVRIR